MASLGTLALGTFTNVSNTAITGSDPVLEVIASTDDADFVRDTSNSDHTGECRFDVATTLPADLGNVDTLSINLRYGLSTTKGTNDWLSLRARVFKSDGTTALTNQLTVVSSGTGIADTTPVNSGAVAFTGVDTAATKAEWQAAQVRLYFEINRDGGGDAVDERVYAAELTGTYTAAAVTGTGALSAQAASADGEGVSSSAGTGTLSAQAADVTGSGTSSSTGTGALAAQAAAVDGAGESAWTGTGALAAQAATVAGEGTVESGAITGTGALSSQAADVEGVGVSASTGTGALSAQSSAVAGTGTSSSTGTGALASQAASVDGAGVSLSTGAGALQAQAATIVGSQELPEITGTGALASASSAAAGSGVSSSAGSGVLAAPAAIVSGAGVSASVGTGELLAGDAELAGEDEPAVQPYPGRSLNPAWPLFIRRALECGADPIESIEEWGIATAEISNPVEANAFADDDEWGAADAHAYSPPVCVAAAMDEEDNFGLWRGARQPFVKDMLLALLEHRAR